MGKQSEQNGEKPGGRLSGAAWAAIGTIGAAVVTAVVTLVTVYLPAARQEPGTAVAAPTRVAGLPSSGGLAPAPASAATVPRSALLDQLTGRWQGQVSAEGQTFTMILEIPVTCAEGVPCGTMTTDLHGCVGDLVLRGINDGPQFDLATVDLRDGSSSSCRLRPGGGDYFTLGRDVLVYAAGYDGSRSGTLRRVG